MSVSVQEFTVIIVILNGDTEEIYTPTLEFIMQLRRVSDEELNLLVSDDIAVSNLVDNVFREAHIYRIDSYINRVLDLFPDY